MWFGGMMRILMLGLVLGALAGGAVAQGSVGTEARALVSDASGTNYVGIVHREGWGKDER